MRHGDLVVVAHTEVQFHGAEDVGSSELSEVSLHPGSDHFCVTLRAEQVAKPLQLTSNSSDGRFLKGRPEGSQATSQPADSDAHLMHPVVATLADVGLARDERDELAAETKRQWVKAFGRRGRQLVIWADTEPAGQLRVVTRRPCAMVDQHLLEGVERRGRVGAHHFDLELSPVAHVAVVEPRGNDAIVGQLPYLGARTIAQLRHGSFSSQSKHRSKIELVRQTWRQLAGELRRHSVVTS
jgi:hypothetical protein